MRGEQKRGKEKRREERRGGRGKLPLGGAVPGWHKPASPEAELEVFLG